jgi:hypothetical protein
MAFGMTVRETIWRQFRQVAADQRKHLPPLTDEMIILDSGFDSLCMAKLVADLEDMLNLAPLDDPDTVFPVTFGALVRVYETAAAQHVTS